MKLVADIEISFPYEDLQRLKDFCESYNLDIANYSCNAIINKLNKDLKVAKRKPSKRIS